MLQTALLAKSIVGVGVNLAPNVRLYTSMFAILCRLINGEKRDLITSDLREAISKISEVDRDTRWASLLI